MLSAIEEMLEPCEAPFGDDEAARIEGECLDAHDSSGGVHSGFHTAWTIFHSPVCVGHFVEPTATG